MPPVSNPTLRQRRLGAELRKLRERAGYTVTQAAAHLGVNQGRVSMIETGRSPLSADRIPAMVSGRSGWFGDVVRGVRKPVQQRLYSAKMRS
ncbi:helix-turn-helix domain-containing protein [Streptomyces tendae]|uniref:helix-turn-helix domain-containing protein n=1 Tax=Streptomyces tendae TaxID=1932 RepID=UPI0037152851